MAVKSTPLEKIKKVEIPKNLFAIDVRILESWSGNVGSQNRTIYTCPNNRVLFIKQLYMVNNDFVTNSGSIQLQRQNGTPIVIFDESVVTKNTDLVPYDDIKLYPGDKIVSYIDTIDIQTLLQWTIIAVEQLDPLYFG